MKISTVCNQTRAVDKYSNPNDKNDLLDDLSRNLNSVETSTQRSLNFQTSWAKRSTSTTFEVDDYLTRQQELALRLENSLRESISIYTELYCFDGVMSANTYNKVLDQLNENFKSALKTLKHKGYVFVLYKNDEVQGVKLFDDEVRMSLWFKKHLGYDYQLFQNPITVPTEYTRSILLEQDWCVNPEELFDKLKAQS